MAIKVGFGFERTGSDPIDSSMVLSKAQMLGINDNLMPDNYFAVCKDDGKMYVYNKSAIPNDTTGKFSVVEGGEGNVRELTQAEYDALSEEEKTNGTVYFITDGQGGGGGSYVLPPATADTLGGVKIGYGLNVTADGTLSATGGGDVNFEIDKNDNYATVTSSGQSLVFDFNDTNTLSVITADPGTYYGDRTLATKDYVDAHASSNNIILVDTTKGGYRADDFSQYVYGTDKILVFYDGIDGAKIAISGEETMESVTFYSVSATYNPTLYSYTLYRDGDTWSVNTRQLATYHRSMGVKNSIFRQETVTFTNPQKGVVNTIEITNPFINDKFLFDDEYTVQLTLNGKSADPSSISKVTTYAIPEYNKLSICVVPGVAIPEVKVMWSMITDHSWKNFWSIYSRNSSQAVTGGWSTANFSFYSSWKWRELYDYLNNYNWRCLEVIINYNGETKRNVARFIPTDGWYGPTYQYPVENEYGSFLPVFWEKNDPLFTGVKYFAGKDGDEKMFFTDATDHDPAIVDSADKTLQGTFNPNTGFKEREDF